MPGITDLTKWVGLAFLLLLFGSVAVQVLTGGLRTRNLIAGRTEAGSQFVSAARVQLLIVSLAAAVQYLMQVWQNPRQFPDVSQNWLLLFGGSQALYLGSKFRGKRTRRFHV